MSLRRSPRLASPLTSLDTDALQQIVFHLGKKSLLKLAQTCRYLCLAALIELKRRLHRLIERTYGIVALSWCYNRDNTQQWKALQGLQILRDMSEMWNVTISSRITISFLSLQDNHLLPQKRPLCGVRRQQGYGSQPIAPLCSSQLQLCNSQSLCA
jgi:hypothetical protein